MGTVTLTTPRTCFSGPVPHVQEPCPYVRMRRLVSGYLFSRDNAAVRGANDSTVCGKQGPEGGPPELTLQLSKPSAAIVASHSGASSQLLRYHAWCIDVSGRHLKPLRMAECASVCVFVCV